ncbi:MAG: phosphatase PAP2 family protein [Deltaproteobacteria bacterium]|nr:phosphatase PAP2 family protein [Deltaproteobacteria bacterium]
MGTVFALGRVSAVVKCVMAIITLVATQGCGTLPNGHGWGQDVTFLPGWERVRDAAVGAAKAPDVWLPTAAALALQINDWDEEVSEWAVKSTPLFGDREDADDASGYLRTASQVAYVTTAFLTPSGDDDEKWAENKARGFAVGLSAIGATYGMTEATKSIVDRTRPDGSDDRSFFSGHASNSAVTCKMAGRNIEYLAMPAWGKTAFKVGFSALSFTAGWARVEAAKHYPSDVLVGMAVGNFLGAFFNDAFLGIDPKDPKGVTIQPTEGGLMLGFNGTF